MTTAVNMFLKTAIRENRIPFELKLEEEPNEVTMKAIEEGRRIAKDDKVKFTRQFKKDLKLAKKQGKNLDTLFNVIKILEKGEKIDDKYRDHSLSGKYKGTRECHIEPDWLLVYEIIDNVLVLLYCID